jgi:hypothetical protein
MAGSDRASDPAGAAPDSVPKSAPGTADIAGSDNDAALSTGGSPRIPPTIDLKATEFTSEAAAGEMATDSAAAATAGPEQSAGPAPGSAGDSHIPNATNGSKHAESGKRPTGLAGGLVPGLVAGLMAGLGGGLLVSTALFALWFTGLIPSRDAGMPAMQERIVALDAQMHELGNRSVVDSKMTDDLARRLTTLEQAVANAPRNAATGPALAERIAAAERAAQTNERALAGLNDHVAAQAARFETLEKTISDEAKAASTVQVSPSAPDVALAARLDALERAVAARNEAAKTPDNATRLAVAALALRDTVASGAPFTAELSTVRALGADAASTAALAPFAATGVPTASALLQQLSTLLPALRQAADAGVARGNGFLERLEANAEKLVRIRPLGEAAGSDPVAILSRVEDGIAKRDLAGTLAQLMALPPAVRVPVDGWINQLEARQKALDSSRRLATEQSRRLVQP